MPRYSAIAPAALPRTEPSAVRTMGPRPDPRPGEPVEPVEPGEAAAQAVSPAAARQATAAIPIRVLQLTGPLLASAPEGLRLKRRAKARQAGRARAAQPIAKTADASGRSGLGSRPEQ
jgi:hypothetical protein